jgi:tripartite-type tricarboxylate transporter receptor subunit TctC
MSKRATAVIAAALLAASCFASARADDWPSRPVRIVVAFSPGGSADQLGRLIGQELSTAFGQQFYVENRPGNSGSIGANFVARAAPDGYTLMIGGSGPHITIPAINPNIGYDPMRDFTHIAMIGADSYVLVASTALGVKNIDELEKLAHGREAPLTSSSPGPGSLGELLLEQFKREAGIAITHVPSPNSGLMDVLGHHIDMTMTALLTVGAQIRSGELVPLAVSSGERNPVFKDIPTFAEQGFPHMRGETWFWLTAPKNLPPAIVEKLNREIRRILKLAKIRAYFAQQALLSMDASPADLTKFLAGEVARWGGLVKNIGLVVQ